MYKSCQNLIQKKKNTFFTFTLTTGQNIPIFLILIQKKDIRLEANFYE